MTPVLFSISYAGLWGQGRLSLPDFITRAGQLGYRSLMLAGKRPHLSPLEASDAFLGSIQHAMKEASVRCEVIGAYTDLAPGRAREVPVMEFQISYVETLARLAASLGGRVVRIFSAYETDEEDPADNWRRVIAVVREMCDRAAAYGVTVAIQNHHDLGVHTDSLLELLTEIDRPNCKLGFDAWSPALRGEDLYECARRAAPHVALTTNADYVQVPRYRYRPERVNYERRPPDMVRAVPFGTGFIDYAAFFQGLRDGGFDGLAVYEMCSPLRGGGSLENLDTCATTYLEWMRSHGLVG